MSDLSWIPKRLNAKCKRCGYAAQSHSEEGYCPKGRESWDLLNKFQPLTPARDKTKQDENT